MERRRTTKGAKTEHTLRNGFKKILFIANPSEGRRISAGSSFRRMIMKPPGKLALVETPQEM
jgi:hypothetical protein